VSERDLLQEYRDALDAIWVGRARQPAPPALRDRRTQRDRGVPRFSWPRAGFAGAWRAGC